MTELEGTAAESKATYEEIKEYVLEKTGLKVLIDGKGTGSLQPAYVFRHITERGLGLSYSEKACPVV